jgi:hypothetical protein
LSVSIRAWLRAWLDRRPRAYSSRVLLAITTVSALITTVRGFLGPAYAFNNFTIYRWSFANLALGLDLYSIRDNLYIDIFKYSPTFALSMAPFWAIPHAAGVVAWNLINAWAPYWAVNRLRVDQKARAFILLFLLAESQITILNAQSNGILVGLMIGAFAAFERGRVATSALLICLGFYIKPFAAVVGILFLFYGQKRRFLAATAMIAAALGLAPMVVTGPAGWLAVHRRWLTMLASDASHEANYSIMTLVQGLTHVTLPDACYLAAGLLLLLLPLARRGMWGDPGYRLTVLASTMIWVVIFNHKAESPTYIIAIAGVALWSRAEPFGWRRVLLTLFALVVTELGSTDAFPMAVRMRYLQPYSLKALPCVLIWIYATYRLLTLGRFGYPAESRGIESIGRPSGVRTNGPSASIYPRPKVAGEASFRLAVAGTD